MELKPSHEMYAQAVIKHGGNLTKAYLEVYPKSKYDSARHSASILLTNVYIKQRVYEILEKNGLGLNEVAKKLSEYMNSNNCYFKELGINLTVRLYDSVLKSGIGIGLTVEDMTKIQQMVHDFEALNQKKQDNI